MHTRFNYRENTTVNKIHLGFDKQFENKEQADSILKISLVYYIKSIRIASTLICILETLFLLRLIVGASSGRVVKHLHYGMCYTFLLTVALLSLVLIRKWKDDLEQNAKKLYYYQVFYNTSMVVWAVMMTLLDGYYHNGYDLTIFMTMIVLVPVVAFENPIISNCVNTISCLIILYALVSNGDTNQSINFACFIAGAVVVNIVFYKTKKSLFLIQYELHEVEIKNLVRITQTDELTGVLNRRAYEEDIYSHDNITNDKFVYVSIDVNGLKVVNDTKGHMAGDELIVGACQCMKESLGKVGNLYRIGGDEFVAILFCDEEKTKETLSEFDTALLNWSGELVDSISVSYGWISKNEKPDASVRQLGAIAEERMYEAKAAHYRNKGVDRRGQHDAHKALCNLYTKILRVNLTDDSYQIVNIDESEQNQEEFATSISEWLCSFGKSGRVHPEDLEEYLRKTDCNYLKDYFLNNDKTLQIIYRRKYNDGFYRVMMEIIRADDFNEDNLCLFIYVKKIDY